MRCTSTSILWQCMERVYSFAIQGHRNYTSFLHFLFCIVSLSLYIACVCVSATYYSFTHPLSIVSLIPAFHGPA